MSGITELGKELLQGGSLLCCQGINHVGNMRLEQFKGISPDSDLPTCIPYNDYLKWL